MVRILALVLIILLLLILLLVPDHEFLYKLS